MINSGDELIKQDFKNRIGYVMTYGDYEMYSKVIDFFRRRIDFLMERENKLQQIEQMFKNEPVDLTELAKLVRGGKIMTERELNKKWLKEQLKEFAYSNDFLEKILDLLSEEYKNGLHQGWFDKEMDKLYGNNDFDSDLLTIINTYGVMKQLKYFQSEIFELNEAIFQYEEQKRVCEQCCSTLHCDKEKEHIAEEIADVMVMLSQFKEYYHIDGKDILDIMKYKINRQIERISEQNGI